MINPQRVLYALGDFLISRLGSLLKHIPYIITKGAQAIVRPVLRSFILRQQKKTA